MAQITDAKLDFYIKNDLNVLLKGQAGCGKSTVVIDAFNRNKLNWIYLSASTIDVYIDLVGVPKEKTNDAGEVFLDFIRPYNIQNDKLQAIFLDEFNRSGKKVRNAVMELLQFKSIQGRRLKNLKIVWAAVNPDENDSNIKYDVETIDPAQLDRFQIQLEMPYEPNEQYFTNKFGKANALSAISWWRELSTELKNEISPRRLDYALDVYKMNGDMRDVLHNKANITKLIQVLKNGPIESQLRELLKNKDIATITRFFNDENNYNNSLKYIAKDAEMVKLFVPNFRNEHISTLFGNRTWSDFVLNDRNNFDNSKIRGICEQIVSANQYSQAATNVRDSGLWKHMEHEKNAKVNAQKIVIERSKTENVNKSVTRNDMGNALDAIISNFDGDKLGNHARSVTDFALYTNWVTNSDLKHTLTQIKTCSFAKTSEVTYHRRKTLGLMHKYRLTSGNREDFGKIITLIMNYITETQGKSLRTSGSFDHRLVDKLAGTMLPYYIWKYCAGHPDKNEVILLKNFVMNNYKLWTNFGTTFVNSVVSHTIKANELTF